MEVMCISMSLGRVVIDINLSRADTFLRMPLRIEQIYIYDQQTDVSAAGSTHDIKEPLRSLYC